MNFQCIDESYQHHDRKSSDIFGLCEMDDRDKPLKPRSEFGVRLRQARKSAGLTQVQLAKKVGILQSALSEAENRNDGSLHLAQLAKALNVSAHWLETGEGLREIPGPVDLTGYVKSDLSPQGQELGILLDMIDDRITRVQAYNAATKEILARLGASDAPASSPQSTPETPGTPRK